ncbi:MAG: dockerin type I repeat-containing protein [Candidatus Omnitrophica bacterium]|nr:dockerin type I repeat-containing protein [Candidatus Omnitrophota bacterium]
MSFSRNLKWLAVASLLFTCWLTGEPLEQVTTPRIPSGSGTIVEGKAILRLVTGESQCSLHQEEVEYRFAVSLAPVVSPRAADVFVGSWNGPEQTLVVPLPPVLAEGAFIRVYLYAQARCAVNRRVHSPWSAPGNLSLVPLQWEKYIPMPEQVQFRSVTVRRQTVACLTINFPDSGFAVLDWGLPIRTDAGFTVDAQIVRWSGITLPVISPQTHRYSLGYLPPGVYEFQFNVWGEKVAIYRFLVSSLPVDINQDGQFSAIDLTSLMRMILGLPVTISGQTYFPPYPAWLIEAADVNGDELLDITDLIQLLPGKETTG